MHLLTRRALATTLLLLALLLIVSSCQVSYEGDLSREAGREARGQIDQLVEQAGEFMAGFCASSSLPVALAGVAVGVQYRRRRSP